MALVTFILIIFLPTSILAQDLNSVITKLKTGRDYEDSVFSKEKLSEIKGDWNVEGYYFKKWKKQEVTHERTIKISDSLIYFIGDEYKYFGAYVMGGSIEEGNLTNPSIDAMIDVSEVFLILYFEDDYMVLKHYKKNLIKGLNSRGTIS